MIESLRRHWREYLMEAAGLGGFIIGASLLTVLLEHPNFFVMKGWLGYHPLLRRVPLGIIMGAYIALIVNMWGERSGAQLRLGFRLWRLEGLVDLLHCACAGDAGSRRNIFVAEENLDAKNFMAQGESDAPRRAIINHLIAEISLPVGINTAIARIQNKNTKRI